MPISDTSFLSAADSGPAPEPDQPEAKNIFGDGMSFLPKAVSCLVVMFCCGLPGGGIGFQRHKLI